MEDTDNLDMALELAICSVSNSRFGGMAKTNSDRAAERLARVTPCTTTFTKH